MKTLITLVLLIIAINCGPKDDIKIYTVVPPEPTPAKVQPFDAEKYPLIDTLKSCEKLRTQAYQSENAHERMQIFDYLFIHGPKHFGGNAVAEFFKHFDGSVHTDWKGTGEMDLINVALSQNRYKAVKEQCLSRMIYYQMIRTQLDSMIFWMDSLRILFPQSKLFNQNQYNKIISANNETTEISKSKTLNEPDRLWKMGYVYWKLGTSEWKSDIWIFQKKAKEYFTELKSKYPNSPFNANAIFAIVKYEYAVANEGTVDTTCGIVLKNKFEDLLEEYPGTTARDEILLYNVGYYFCKVSMSRDPDTSIKYLQIADSIFSLVDPEDLFDDDSRKSYERTGSNLVNYLREYGKLDIDFHGELYKSVFFGTENVDINTSGMPYYVKRKIAEYLKKCENFQSRTHKTKDFSESEDAIINKRRLIERAIVTLINVADIESLAAEYAANAKLFYEWEGMTENPFKEGMYAEEYLNADLASPLRPFLVLFIAHRYRCAYECIIANNETKWKKYTELRYGYYLNAAKSRSNIMVNLIAEDMDRERFLYIPDSKRPGR
ncbi:MAG: hypothetical protein WBB37_02285 [bacterium]